MKLQGNSVYCQGENLVICGLFLKLLYLWYYDLIYYDNLHLVTEIELGVEHVV